MTPDFMIDKIIFKKIILQRVWDESHDQNFDPDLKGRIIGVKSHMDTLESQYYNLCYDTATTYLGHYKILQMETQSATICSKLTIETLEQGMKYVQS